MVFKVLLLQCATTGAYHGVEVLFMIGLPFLELNEAVIENTQIRPNATFSDQDREFSEYIMALWTNFAKYG